MGRGAFCDQSSGLLYGATVPRRRLPAQPRIGDLDQLRARLVSRHKLSAGHIFDIALCMKCQSELDEEIGWTLAQNLDRLLDELARQAGCSRELDLLSSDWGRPGWRDYDVKLSASDWHLALAAVQISALDDFPIDEQPFDGQNSRDTFDVLSGGREPEELESPWPCEWGECGFSGPVEGMVYYNGSGMTGFLCQDCAAAQIRSDGL